MFRSHNISSKIETEFLKAKIPYHLLGRNKFFDHSEIKTLINYYFFLKNKDDISLSEIFNKPTRNIGEITFSRLALEAEKQKKSIYKVMEESSNEDLKKFVNLIESLDLKFTQNDPSEFVDLLLEIIEYETFISKQRKLKRNYKESMNLKTCFLTSIQI